MLKNITLSADQNLIKKAREKAQKENTTLNQRFREWLQRYITIDNQSDEYVQLMNRLGHINSGKKFTRDELNERQVFS